MKWLRSLFIFQTVMLFAFTKTAKGSDFIVTSMIRELPMKSTDPIYKDFYINAGSNNGLKKGAIIEALRKIAAYDNINSKLLGETTVKVGKLKLIHVDKNISVARLVNLYEKESNPMTGYDTVMIGDIIQVAEKQ